MSYNGYYAGLGVQQPGFNSRRPDYKKNVNFKILFL